MTKFRKIINSKKEVYESLVSNSKNDFIDSELINKNIQELDIKNSELKELEALFDEINIDIKVNRILLTTDLKGSHVTF